LYQKVVEKPFVPRYIGHLRTFGQFVQEAQGAQYALCGLFPGNETFFHAHHIAGQAESGGGNTGEVVGRPAVGYLGVVGIAEFPEKPECVV
jgi:hypothetical protein